MFPHKVKSGTRQILPACHQVGTKLIETEIRVRKRSLPVAILYRIDTIRIADLIRGKDMEALVVRMRPGIGRFLKVAELLFIGKRRAL